MNCSPVSEPLGIYYGLFVQKETTKQKWCCFNRLAQMWPMLFSNPSTQTFRLLQDRALASGGETVQPASRLSPAQALAVLQKLRCEDAWKALVPGHVWKPRLRRLIEIGDNEATVSIDAQHGRRHSFYPSSIYSYQPWLRTFRHVSKLQHLSMVTGCRLSLAGTTQMCRSAQKSQATSDNRPYALRLTRMRCPFIDSKVMPLGELSYDQASHLVQVMEVMARSRACCRSIIASSC